MVSQPESTGITLPYETAAMRGDPMPEGLKSYDALMFQNLTLLYKRYREKMISREQATKEKKTLLEAYRIDKFGDEVVQDAVRLWKDIETAASAYCLSPSIETADALIKAIYKVGRKTDEYEID